MPIISSLSKATKAPAKISKPTTSKPPKTPKPALSAEIIVDSDESSEEEETRSKGKYPATADSISAIPEPTIAKLPLKSLSSIAKSSRKRKAPSPPPPKSASSSHESSEDSKDDSDDSKEASENSVSSEGSPTPVRPQNALAASAQVESLKSPTSAKSLTTSKTPLSKAAASTLNGVPSEEEGDSSSEKISADESESESGDGDGDEASTQSPKKRSLPPKPAPKQTLSSYKPPLGFELASVSHNPSSKLPETFGSSNLLGKQIWHITVPASVPISSVKEVSMQSIQKGTAVLSYKGAEYGLVADTDAQSISSQALLLPSSQSHDYRPSWTIISNTLHLQEIVNLPNLARIPPRVLDDKDTTTSALRERVHQQPQGLKMRYHPFGTSDVPDSNPPSKNVEKAPQFRAPKAAGQLPPTKKMKLDNGKGDAEMSPARPKKRKAQPGPELEVAQGVMDLDSSMGEDADEGRSKRSRTGLNNAVSPADVHIGKDKQEAKAKRKEERKRRKHLDIPSASRSVSPQIPSSQNGMKERESELKEQLDSPQKVADTSPHKNPGGETAKRKDGRRRRKESSKPSTTENDPMSNVILDAEKQEHNEQDEHREISIHLPTSKHSSPVKETKEERAKRKEEKRKRAEMAAESQ
ncbi:hypothetical protein MMC28_009451 [Mycoblastus sanguinarius]|nr:hypothetical protein [Mycoblastus sanguinarius]